MGTSRNSDFQDIDVTTDASPAQMAQLQTELAMFCPIAKVVRASGTVLTEVWTVTPPSAN